MSDNETQSEVVREEHASRASSKKPYAAPQLTLLGTLAELTKGGDQEQRGEGPGFSL
jgi:hypothetical protein